MLVNTFNVKAYDTGNNHYRFEDKTSYPATSNFDIGADDVENDAGRIIVLSNDNFASDFNYLYYDNTILLPKVNLETQIINEEYMVLAVLVPTWSNIDGAGLTFDNGDICIYDGVYYYYDGTSGGVSTTPDADPNWVVLETYADDIIWDHLDVLINSNNNKCSWQYLVINEKDNQHDVYVTACHEFEVKIVDTSSTKYLKVSVTEYDNTTVDGYDEKIIDNPNYDDVIYFKCNVEHDQQYIIKVEKYDDTDTLIGDPIYLTQFIICKFKSCYNKLVQAIYCCDNTKDVCDETENSKLDKRYRDMLRLESIYSSILQMINVEAIRYLGVYDMGQTRNDYINKVQEYIAKMNLIVGRCEDCNNTTEDNPCNNC
jgi:hypothetical protein